MDIEESIHWKKQKAYRKNIEGYMIEYAINNSEHQQDKHHKDALNAIARIPENGKKLKVIFRITGKDRIIAAQESNSAKFSWPAIYQAPDNCLKTFVA